MTMQITNKPDIMRTEKLVYLSPTTESIVVSPKEGILQASTLTTIATLEYDDEELGF